MKILNLLGRILLSILVSIFGIVEILIFSIIPILKAKDDGYVWFGTFYQPFVVLFACIPLIPQIAIAIENNDSRLFWIILIIFEMLILTFIINIVIELIFSLRNKETIFNYIQELQKYSNNYALIIISLLSLLVGALPDIVSFDNYCLLVVGCIFFASTVSSDAYREFVYSKGEVKELAQKIKSTFSNDL